MKLDNLYLLCFMFTMLIASCSEVPKQYLQFDEMKETLWDMMYADKVNAHRSDSVENIDVLSKEYAKVLAYRKISQKQFVESFVYYQSNPDLQNRLNDSLLVYGERLSEEVSNRIRNEELDKLWWQQQKKFSLKPPSEEVKTFHLHTPSFSNASLPTNMPTMMEEHDFQIRPVIDSTGS